MSETRETIVTGPRWSPATHTIRDFLARNRIPHRFVDAETVEIADGISLPLVETADGARLEQPTLVELAEHCGLHTHADNPFYDLVVIGAGLQASALRSTAPLRGSRRR